MASVSAESGGSRHAKSYQATPARARRARTSEKYGRAKERACALTLLRSGAQTKAAPGFVSQRHCGRHKIKKHHGVSLSICNSAQ